MPWLCCCCPSSQPLSSCCLKCWTAPSACCCSEGFTLVMRPLSGTRLLGAFSPDARVPLLVPRSPSRYFKYGQPSLHDEPSYVASPLALCCRLTGSCSPGWPSCSFSTAACGGDCCCGRSCRRASAMRCGGEALDAMPLTVRWLPSAPSSLPRGLCSASTSFTAEAAAAVGLLALSAPDSKEEPPSWIKLRARP